jgi:ribosomal protein L16 Arg81 hydroxylase
VVGAKRVRLFDPKHTPLLYPHDKSDRMRWNSSSVQPSVRAPDVIRFPRVAEAPFFECVLQPGEMLFIPPRWWHAVDAADTLVFSLVLVSLEF